MPRENKATKKFFAGLKKITPEQRVYFKQLHSQGKDHMNICPTCFGNGARNPDCKNKVIVIDVDAKAPKWCECGRV